MRISTAPANWAPALSDQEIVAAHLLERTAALAEAFPDSDLSSHVPLPWKVGASMERLLLVQPSLALALAQLLLVVATPV